MFENYFAQKPLGDVDLIKWCKTAKFKEQVIAFRTTSNEKVRQRIKRNLPCITPSGIFKTRSRDGLVQHTGFICIDIDHKDNGVFGPEWFDNGASALGDANVAVYAIPVKDTVKEREHGGEWGLQRVRTLDRSRLVAVQTPQIFRRETLLKAHQYAQAHGITGTDDASLAEAMGEKIVLLQGDERNHKVTTMDDVPILEFYMTGPTEHRVGSGYDVHELMEGRKLVLGGVTIPYEKGLKGHSDADVLIHAVMDALLGAAG